MHCSAGGVFLVACISVIPIHIAATAAAVYEMDPFGYVLRTRKVPFEETIIIYLLCKCAGRDERVSMELTFLLHRRLWEYSTILLVIPNWCDDDWQCIQFQTFQIYVTNTMGVGNILTCVPASTTSAYFETLIKSSDELVAAAKWLRGRSSVRAQTQFNNNICSFEQWI